MNNLIFTKLQGQGNDFLIIAVDDVWGLDFAQKLAREICRRNYGAGADGIVFIARSDKPGIDFDSRIINADGSEAEVSGNGTRCAAAYVYHQGLIEKPEVYINTIAGIKHGRLVKHEVNHYEFEFEMGTPILSSAGIPILTEQPLDMVVGYHLKLGGDIFEVTCTSMGNPHCSIFLPQLEENMINEIGPLIEHHPAFPNRTNVEFVRVISRDEIEVRFWERGVGRTNSSGTGSCGAAVASVLNGYTGRNVRINTLGGILRVNWRDDNTVLLTGAAEVIYEGRWLRGI